MNDEAYMRRAIELAKKGVGWTSPNPMVGAVIVKDGRIIGEGYHRGDSGFIFLDHLDLQIVKIDGVKKIVPCKAGAGSPLKLRDIDVQPHGDRKVEAVADGFKRSIDFLRAGKAGGIILNDHVTEQFIMFDLFCPKSKHADSIA